MDQNKFSIFYKKLIFVRGITSFVDMDTNSILFDNVNNFYQLYFWMYGEKWAKCNVSKLIIQENGVMEIQYHESTPKEFTDFLRNSFEKYPGQFHKYYIF